MTIVKMLETCKGTEDGFTVRQFYAGEVYSIRENLARSFFTSGYAEKFREKKLKRRRFVNKTKKKM